MFLTFALSETSTIVAQQGLVLNEGGPVWLCLKRNKRTFPVKSVHTSMRNGVHLFMRL